MIKNLNLKSDRFDSKIAANATTGEINIKGVFTYNQKSLFEELLVWMDNYFQNPQKITQIIFQMEFAPKSISKLIVNVISKANKNYSKEHEIEIFWHYPDDDEDLEETGEDLKLLAKVPFYNIKEHLQKSE